MSILEELLSPLSLDDFEKNYLFKQPFAAPGSAKKYRKLISWDMLNEIFASGYDDCWLPREGKLPPEATGKLTFESAMLGFSEGRTVLVRHAEKAHPALGEIARDFHKLFRDPIDIQVYCTPPGEEGFNWHYDVEEVFVIQSSGEKEFVIRKNAENPPPVRTRLPKTLDFEKDCIGPEIRCHLQAGDFLYIPAGYWHKARAITPSFHLSVGVMALTGARYLELLIPELEKHGEWRRRLPMRREGVDLMTHLIELRESLDRLLNDEKRLASFTDMITGPRR